MTANHYNGSLAKKIFLANLFLFSTLYADDWRRTNGPEGGWVSDLLIVGDDMYAATEGGVYHSTDCGELWTRSSEGIPVDLAMSSVTISPTGDLFASSSGQGGLSVGRVFRSTDSGETWGEASTGLPGTTVLSLASNEAGHLFAGMSVGIYRSTDSGDSWSWVAPHLVFEFKVDLGKIYGIGPGSLWRSTDGGNTWLERGNNIKDVFVASTGDLFAVPSVSDSIFHSSDCGETWEFFSAGFSFMKEIEITPLGNIYVSIEEFGSKDQGTDIFCSTDTGATWTKSNLRSHKSRTETKEEMLIAGTGGGFFRLEGGSWVGKNDGLVASTVTALEATDQGILAGTNSGSVSLTTDFGELWGPMTGQIPGGSILDLAFSKKEAWAAIAFELGLDAGVFYLPTFVDNWVDRTPELGRLYNAIDVSDPANTVCTASDIGIYRSTDLGLNWDLIVEGLPTDPYAWEVIWNSVSGSWNALLSDGIYESTDDAESWTLFAPITVLGSGQMDVDPVTGLVLAVNEATFNIEICSQGSCTPLTNGWPPGSFPLAIGFDADGDVFASTGFDVLHYSFGAGQWTSVGAGIENIPVFSFASVNSPESGGAAVSFAGTGGHGVFVFGEVTDVDEHIPGIPEYFSLAQNYPNPFNPTTVIQYKLPERSAVSLEIYNLIGERVSTLIDREIEPGYHEVTFDAEGLPSGIYFYRLQAGLFVETKKLLLLK